MNFFGDDNPLDLLVILFGSVIMVCEAFSHRCTYSIDVEGVFRNRVPEVLYVLSDEIVPGR